ncbi:MAG: methyltransferase domain-containing protein [Candidatus Omnitrophota bacterium]
MLEKVKCNLCGSDRYIVVYKTYIGDITASADDYRITEHLPDLRVRLVRCLKCGLIYTNPRISMQHLRHVYIQMVDTVYVEEEKGRRMSSRVVLKTLRKLRKSGKLLDVGCAVGFLLSEAKKEGWDVYGIELSEWASGYAKDKLGLDNVFQGTLKDAKYPDNFFDVVVLKDTIEHLPDPMEILIEARRILKPDGILCVNTPDIDSLASKVLKARWWGIKQAHLYYFSRRTLTKMLNASGFMPVLIRPCSRIFSVEYWSDKLKEYNSRIYGLFSFLVKCGVFRKELLKINLRDQIEIYGRKLRKMEYLEELESMPFAEKKEKMKVVAVLPAYNAAKTLEKTVKDIPRETVDEIILVDDVSSDNTVTIAKELGLNVFVHEKNTGYGGNQKTCYKKALESGADIVVMVHPDYQYDPKMITRLVESIKEGRADAVLGSRMLKGGALEGGMPLWKHNSNILLTALENIVFGTFLSEYHSGFRAYSAKLLRTIKFQDNSDGFVFDTEIITQTLLHNFKIEEIPIRTRYFDEASTIKFLPSCIYGMGILRTLFKYILHTRTFIKFKQFR